MRNFFEYFVLRRTVVKTLKVLVWLIAVLIIVSKVSYSDSNRNAKHSDSKRNAKHSVEIDGVAVIGDNNIFQQPLWDLGEPFGTAFFNWVWAHNSNGMEPTLITEDTPGNSVLAGGVDPVAQFLGLVPTYVPQSMVNVPLHETPITIDSAGNRGQVPLAEGQPGDAVTRSFSNEPITVDGWLKASGKLKVRCFENGSATVDIKLKGLIPNGVYTLWTIYKVDQDDDGVIDGIAPYPFGGVPNVIIPDKKGKARVSRTVGYCPLTDENLLFIDIAYHSDGNVYGGAPDLPFASFPQPMGSVTHTHVQFPFSVNEIN